jgi:hypothetical protein
MASIEFKNLRYPSIGIRKAAQTLSRFRATLGKPQKQPNEKILTHLFQ